MKDAYYFQLALDEAKKGVGHTRPNPPVGAVVVKDGAVIGRGCHKRCGGAHAEVAAIKAASGRCSTEGAKLFVTLEPCSKPGRVGACTDAIIAAGIRKVFYLCEDPNPKNRGKAKAALRKAGVECISATELDGIDEYEDMLQAGADLIAPFKKHIETGLPLVTVKIAMTLDGKICDDYGEARWVSCEEARMATGRFREQVDAIMVGAETIRKDNPSLLSHGKKNDDLIRVVISRSGKLPEKARIFTDGAKNETLVFPDAELAVRELGKMGVMHILCEGGMMLATSLAEAGLVDSWVTVLCPKVIGGRKIAEAARGDLVQAKYKGDDIIVRTNFIHPK